MSKWVTQLRSKVKKIIPHSRKRVLDETYDIKDTLGGGLFSVVKKAVNRKTGELVAIKIYDKSRLTPYDKECTATEVEILKSMKHANIITMKDCIDTRSKLYLIEELMVGGDLLERIRKKKKFAEKDACRLFSQVLVAIAHLHANGIAHRDIKPDNLLLSSDSDDAVVKLADFGFAKKVGTGTLHTPCGSPVYTAPEVVREDAYDKSVDVWSAGVLLYIMLCGYPPFYHRNPSKLFEEIKKAVFDFPAEQWGSISNSAKDLVSAMLKENPTDRITAQQALEHPWIVLMRSDSTDSISAKPDSSPSSYPVTSTTTTASAAETVVDKKLFKARMNKAFDQGSQFNLCAATSSPLWARRQKTSTKSEKLERSDKSEKFDKSDKSEKSDKSDKSESDKSDRSSRRRKESYGSVRSDKSDGAPRNTTKCDNKGEEDRRRELGRMFRSESKDRDDKSYYDRSEMSSVNDNEAFSLSRTCSDTSEESFSFMTNVND